MNQPDFDVFTARAARAGLETVNHGRGHWQLRGGTFTVNYYASTGTIYVNGTHSNKHARRTGDYDDAIKAATAIPRKRKGRDKKVARLSVRKARAARRRLLQKDPHCRWCGRYVEEKAWCREMQATLEHVIPLGRGGSNGPDNLALACLPCNDKRANDMPELEDPDWGKK